MRCDQCKHWDIYADPTIAGYRPCRVIDDRPHTPTKKAFILVHGEESGFPDLLTRPDFFCALFETNK